MPTAKIEELEITPRPPGAFAATITAAQIKVVGGGKHAYLSLTLGDNQGFVALHTPIYIRRVVKQVLARPEAVPALTGGDSLVAWMDRLIEAKTPFAFVRKWQTSEEATYEDVQFAKP